MDRKKLIGMFCFIALSVSNSLASEANCEEKSFHNFSAAREREFCEKYEKVIVDIIQREGSTLGCRPYNFSCNEAIKNCLGGLILDEKCVNYSKNLAERSIKECKEGLKRSTLLNHSIEKLPSLQDRVEAIFFK